LIHGRPAKEEKEAKEANLAQANQARSHPPADQAAQDYR